MRPAIHFPYRQGPRGVGPMYFQVRTAVPPLALAPAIRRLVATLDRNVPLTGLKTQTAQIEQSIWPYRLFAVLCGFFASLALLLSAVGRYGVMAYTVARPSAEIGIRMALGAERGDVVWMVLREALLLAAAGAALGLPAALAATRLVRSRLFGVQPSDPATFAGAAAVLLAAAALAAFIPARRAASLDAMGVLRNQ